MDLARNLRVECISRLHPTAPLCIDPGQTVAEAVNRMRKEHVGCLLVCASNRLVGIFTERDLMRRVIAADQPLSRPVFEVMTPNPVVVHFNQPIGTAVRLMEEGGYRHLPVLDQANQPIGVLSVKRIVHYLVEHFPSTVYNQPPDPASIPYEREGA